MFEFRLITANDGTQVIDTNLKTPYESLTPMQLLEYQEVSDRLYFMKRMGRKGKKRNRSRKVSQI